MAWRMLEYGGESTGAVLEPTVRVPEPAVLVDSFHVNPDLAPATTLAQRRWGVKDIAALWISMSACILDLHDRLHH